MKQLDALRKIAAAKGKDCLVLQRQCNISWLLGGRTHVGLAADIGVAEIVITPISAYLLANHIEMNRLLTEELEGVKLERAEYPWQEPAVRLSLLEELTGGSYITDSLCEEELLALRSVLDEAQCQTLTELSRDCADAVATTCLELKRGMSEYAIAGLLAKQCYERGIDPLITLIAADERIDHFRHPLPTNKMAEERVMVVLGGRRRGLYSCLTRMVSFVPPDTQLLHKRDAVHRLQSLMYEQTVPGAHLTDIFAQLVKGYREVGFDDEWKQHHQGGLCGFQSREIKADFHRELIVQAGMAFAWNPSITGFKGEETMLVGRDHNQNLTQTPQLPALSIPCGVGTILLPDILQRRI